MMTVDKVLSNADGITNVIKSAREARILVKERPMLLFFIAANHAYTYCEFVITCYTLIALLFSTILLLVSF